MPEWLRASAPGTYAGCVGAASKKSVAVVSRLGPLLALAALSVRRGCSYPRSRSGGPESAPSNPICPDQAIQSRLVRNFDSIPTRDQGLEILTVIDWPEVTSAEPDSDLRDQIITFIGHLRAAPVDRPPLLRFGLPHGASCQASLAVRPGGWRFPETRRRTPTDCVCEQA